uniref:GDNF/GAS1 domain-containing protein n=1 Tax=Timema douglasi TaxID=61478 RepID=A0A7R8VHE0_TIMDO|nr:unnamed protein product [Timema douglasi]
MSFHFSGSEPENELPKNFSYQSTCHLALDICNNNYSCRMSLQPVLHHCDQSQCNREACMEALQNFYRNAELKWSLEIAFCLCSVTRRQSRILWFDIDIDVEAKGRIKAGHSVGMILK